MYTLLLKLSGPLQSWGTDSKFDNRRTESAPSKSGIIGMIAAALGRRRDADLSDLNNLEYGVRADCPGTAIVDYHTAKSPVDEKLKFVTYRYYIADAAFLVGISSDDAAVLEMIEQALKHPVYPLYLGRRSCPPDQPLVLGLVEQSLTESLMHYPWLGSRKNNVQKPKFLKVYLEGRSGGIVRKLRDVPQSFNPENRRFHTRLVTESLIPLDDAGEQHDPIKELEDYDGTY